MVLTAENHVSEIFAARIDGLNWSVRTLNCLHNAGITTIGQLAQSSPSELMLIGNFGRTCLNEVARRLGDLELTLCMRKAPTLDVHPVPVSLRDWFAGQALGNVNYKMVNPAHQANLAYELADAMLAERSKAK